MDALQKLGRYKEAIKVYNKAIEIRPALAEAWYNKGVVLSKLENKRSGKVKISF